MVQTLSKSLTLSEFLLLEETEPASEYIDGEIIQKPMPRGKHGKIQGKLVTAMNAVLAPRRIAYAFLELRCTFGGRSIVPDVSVFVEDRIPSEEKGEIANVFQTAPDWAIEIISPDSAACRDSGIQRHAKVTKKNSPLFETKDSNRVDNLSRRANGVCLRSFTADTSV